MTTTTPLEFDVSAPLPPGTVVLEASAGTGKTHAVAALAVRLLGEGDTTIDRLLMVTFGRNATRELRARVRRLHTQKGVGLVVIDYLQLMRSSRYQESREQEISDISRNLKGLAKELNIPVVALAQLNRKVEERSDKRPVLSDLRESGAIEQDADMVMFLYRDEYYNPDTEDKNLAECIVAKNRSGETGMFKLGWKGEYTKFSNVEFALKEE